MLLPWMSPHALVVQAFLERFSAQSDSDWLCVYDAAASPHLAEAIVGDGVDPMCLFSAKAHLRLARVAPYIVPLPRSGEAVRILGHVWGSGAAFFLRTRLDCGAVRAHLREHMRPSAEPLTLLRLYDPRVLRALLRVSTSEDTAQLLAGIEELYMEADSPGLSLSYTLRDGCFVSKEVETTWIRQRESPERLLFEI